MTTEFCREHGMLREIHENTLKIIAALHGTLGTNDVGLVGRMVSVETRMDALETDGRRNSRTWSDRFWSLALSLLPFLAFLIWYAFLGAHQSVTAGTP